MAIQQEQQILNNNIGKQMPDEEFDSSYSLYSIQTQSESSATQREDSSSVSYDVNVAFTESIISSHHIRKPFSSIQLKPIAPKKTMKTNSIFPRLPSSPSH